MSIFCLLLVPFFVWFRRVALLNNPAPFPDKGAISGFVGGFLLAWFEFSRRSTDLMNSRPVLSFFTHFFTGPVFTAVLPFAVYVLVKKLSEANTKCTQTEAVNFALAWVIPVLAFRSMYLGSLPDPVRLMIMPLLILVLVIALPDWFFRVLDEIGWHQALAVAVLVAAPVAANAASWAFLTGRTIIGWLCLLAVLPAAGPVLWPAGTKLKGSVPWLKSFN